jgi:predicted transcriptional regulator YheO
MKKSIKLLLMILLGIAGICLSGCYQRFYYELKTDHLLVSAVDYTSFSKLSMSKTESDFDKICEKHKLNFSEKDSLWGYNSILWSNGKKHRSISVYAESKKYTRISFSCRKVDVSRMQSIINDFKSYLQRNNIAFKEKHYTQWKSEIYLLN